MKSCFKRLFETVDWCSFRYLSKSIYHHIYVSICVSSMPEVQHHCTLAYVLQVWSSNTYTSSSVRFTVYVWVCFLSLCICTTWMLAVCEVRRQPQILGFESYGWLWATTYLFIIYLEALGTHSCVRAMSALNHWASHLFNLLYVTFIELFKSLIGIYKEIIPLCVDYLTLFNLFIWNI